jgi:hypothetical protein
MAGRVILATVAGSRANQRLVVSIVQSESGQTTIEIQEQHHGEGVGWFDQRTLALDPRQWQQLQSILGAAPEAASIAAEAGRAPDVVPFHAAPPPARRWAAGGHG